jgi:hypothetical protein
MATALTLENRFMYEFGSHSADLFRPDCAGNSNIKRSQGVGNPVQTV